MRIDEFTKIPDDQKTEEICLAAIEHDGWALKYVPNERKTEAMCLAAVKDEGYVFIYVPEVFRTKEMCFAAEESILADPMDDDDVERLCLRTEVLSLIYSYPFY